MSFYSISKEEMHKFLSARGFQPIQLPNTYELVYGKIVNVAGFKLSLRVYTAIEASGHSRAKGEDAIRVQFYYMYEGQPVPVGASQKCLRVKTWEKNLGKAIDQHEQNFKICPRCGAPMVERQRRSDGAKFWGCVTYFQTRCSGKPDDKPTALPRRQERPKPEPRKPEPKLKASKVKRPVRPVSTDPMDRFRIPPDMISEHQKRVEEVYRRTTHNIMMRALAGSGKTTMLKHLASFREEGQRIAYLAFNKKNAVEGAKKLPREVVSMTTHRFCGLWLRQHFKMPERQDGQKNYRIMEEVYPLLDRNSKPRKRVRKAAFRLTNLAKHYACKPDDRDAIKAVMDQYTFDLESEGEVMTVLEVVSEVLQKSLPGKYGMDFNFDDMLWWPVVLGLEPPKYDVLLADEVQDFNACQIEIVRRMMEQGCRVIAVGDPYQAVYRFRGADSKAFFRLAETLTNGSGNCQELTLPTNYRCGKAHIEFVRQNTVVKEIEAAPTALEGEIVHLDYSGVLDLIADDLGVYTA